MKQYICIDIGGTEIKHGIMDETELFLAKDKTAYCEAIIEGATNKVGGILIMAVLLAGICGQLIETSGLVDTLAMLYTFTSGAPTQEEKTCRDTLHRKFDSCFSDPNTSI